MRVDLTQDRNLLERQRVPYKRTPRRKRMFDVTLDEQRYHTALYFLPLIQKKSVTKKMERRSVYF